MRVEIWGNMCKHLFFRDRDRLLTPQTWIGLGDGRKPWPFSLQLYNQPFVSAGHYSEFKEVFQPRAENYEARWYIFEGPEISLKDGYYHLFLPWTEGKEVTFNNPDFNFRQFRLNME